MHRLLKAQIKKAFGKEFELENAPDSFRNFVEMVQQAYHDMYIERQMLEHTLEVNSAELTRANRDIRQNHELLRSVTESLGDVIFYKDLEYRYIGCNRRYAEIVGMSEEEVKGKDDFELFEKKRAENIRAFDRSMLAMGCPMAINEWMESEDGKKTFFSTVKSPLLDSKGEIIGIVGISRDITHEKVMQDELESKKLLLIQQGRLASMGEMIGNIAHQWRQPLNALGLIVQKIKYYQSRGVLDQSKVNDSVEKSMELIRGMSGTIDDFREFFNPNKKREMFFVKEAIDKAYSIVESGYHSKLIGYELVISDESVAIDGYKNEFAQVVVNLLNNAKDVLMERSVANAQVLVSVKRVNKMVEVCICDNGGGIKKSVQPKIFDPYFTTKEEGKGTGIGLYMSKMIIEDHMGGRLTAKNLKEGACFTITV